MSARATLDEYLRATRARLRALVWSRAGAAVGATLLLLSVLAIALLQRSGFPEQQVWLWRGAILLLLITAATSLLWRPLRRLQRNDGAPEFERQSPEQQGRLATYMELRERETRGESSLLTDLLAQDALNVAAREPEPPLLRRALPFAAVGIATVLVLAGLLMFGGAGWGFGSRHLLLGVPLPKEAIALRSLSVQPGNATLRRNSDLRVLAVARGFDPDTAQLLVRFADAQDWERAPMKRLDDGRFEFTLFALHGPMRYQVRADGVQSTEHAVNVVDAPRIDGLRLTYHYPEWTGLAQQSDDTNRDIRAVAGTAVDLEIQSNLPLDSPVLQLVDAAATDSSAARHAALQGAGTRSTGRITVATPARYRIAARVANELVPLSDEYEIEVLPDQKPTIEIVKPGRDARASSIEEVPVRVRAEDDFRLRDVELRYAVNGGSWESVNIARGTQQTEDTTLLRLEGLGGKTPLQPGDLVSYYAVARDHEQSVQTDLYMVQVQAFDRRYTQGAEGGGGGGGGESEEQNAISERQKEILLATWNLQRERDAAAKAKSDAATTQRQNDSAKMLGELQATLEQQTRTLAERTKARAGDSDPRVAEFLAHLANAATAMTPAATHLQARRLDDAIPVEQQALQHLQRAEATFRDIQVTRQQGGGGGGGGNQSMSDLSELFELEMDLEKNQYETESQVAEQREQKPELEEALRKLKELAERQEKAAQQAARAAEPSKEQRWQQDQLRREAEELRRKLEQLARNEQQQKGGQQSSQGRNPGQSEGQGQSQSGQGGGSQRTQGSQQGSAGSALESVRPALDQLRSANNTPAGAEQAARRLREALERVDRQQQQQPGNAQLAAALDKLADDADRMTQSQREIQRQLQDGLAGTAPLGADRAQALAGTKQELLEELNTLQSELRSSTPGKEAPQTRKRVGEILDDLGKSGAASRLSRSASELQFGRAREAAPREGIITEALEKLARDLHEASAIAGQEARQAGNGATPQQLLSEIAALRSALAQAQQEARDRAGAGQRSAAAGEPGRQASNEPGSDAAKPGESQGQSQSQSQGQGQGQGQGQNAGQPGSQSGGQDGGAQNGGGMSGGGNRRGGLAAWNAIAPGAGAPRGSQDFDTPMPQQRPLAPQSRELAQMSDQLQQLEERLRSGRLTRAEIEALRRLNSGVRNLQAGELAARGDDVRKLVERVELAALAASQKAARDAPANAAPAANDTPAQREAAAEYYRRLGGS